MTVKVYGLDCSSSKKTRLWLEKNEIPFEERNILKEPLTVSELQSILRMSLDGTEGIIATRSKVYKELQLNLEELSLQELLEFIHEHPRLLRSPIIFDEKRLLVGYHNDEIRQFLPRQARKTQWLHWRLNNLNLAKG